MPRISVTLIMIAGLLVGCAVKGRSTRENKKEREVSAENPTEFPNPPEAVTVRSDVLAEDRQIYVQLPTGYGRSVERYPVLFVLDAEWLFHLAAAHVRYYSFDEVTDEKIPRMIVVGIPNTDRDRDYTPTPNSGNDLAFPTAGKAADFLRFLKEELIPMLDRRFRTLPGRTIVGWSFSGLFAAYAALEEPDLFDAHLCISPAIWWDDDFIYERMLTVKINHPKRMVFTLGSNEAGGWVYNSTKRLLRRLEKNPVAGLSVNHFEFDSVGHSWGVASAMDKGLQWLFEGYIAPEEVIAGGMTAIEAYYSKLSQQWGYTVVPHPRVFRAAANREWSAGNHDAAINILISALENESDDSATYYELGQMYKALGDTDAALQCTNDAILAEQKKPVPNEISLRNYRAAVEELANEKRAS